LSKLPRARLSLIASRIYRRATLKPLQPHMPLNNELSSALGELIKQVAREQDLESLRELVGQINLLLDAIETRVAGLSLGERLN
jgi:hypothetical protein